MFTGLIEEVGAVAHRSGADLTILAEVVLEDLQEGDSIAIDGACLTAVNVQEDRFVVQMSPETMERSTLGSLRPGDAVNLERAMAMGDRFGGHFVQGHVDGVGRIEDVRQQGEFSLWRFRAPDEASRYLIPKGSVAVDGISLTVVEPKGDVFDVAVIPETLQRTKLPSKRAGDSVNIEADMLGKHIFTFINRGREGGLTMETLSRHGFA
jgi:riboflavin synthase